MNLQLPLKSTGLESVQEEESSCTRFLTNVRQRKVAGKKQKEVPSSSSSGTRESKQEDKVFDKMDVLGLKILGVAATAIFFSPISALLLADFLIWESSVLRDEDSSDIDDGQKLEKE